MHVKDYLLRYLITGDAQSDDSLSTTCNQVAKLVILITV